MNEGYLFLIKTDFLLYSMKYQREIVKKIVKGIYPYLNSEIMSEK